MNKSKKDTAAHIAYLSAHPVAQKHSFSTNVKSLTGYLTAGRYNNFRQLPYIKTLLFGCFWICFGTSYAQTYYISSLNGDDNNNGTSPGTAWATIERVNKVIPSLKPGNSVLFERGGIYYGSMSFWNVSGSENNPITFGAYGLGEMPMISGAKQVTGWQQIDGNLWKANVPDRPDNIDILFMDGKKYYPARFPNQGYRTVTDHYSGGMQDNTLNFPDGYWNGATVAFKVHDWEIRRDTVSRSYSDGRIDKIGDNVDKIPDAGWGFFFQNHIHALDTIGEWVYNKHDATLTLCTNKNPNGQRIEYMDAKYGMEIGYPGVRDCYIHIEGLCFRHYRKYSIYALNGKNLEIRRNKFVDCWAGPGIGGFDKCRISENTITDVENIGVTVGNLTDSRIHGNIIRRIGTSLDHGWSAGISMGMFANDHTPNDRCEITMNIMDSIGYNAMFVMFTQNTVVKNNVINYSMLCLSDGGAIYFGYNPATPRIFLGNQIIGNIIMNTIGNSDGTPYKNNSYYWRHGIYLDDGTGNVTVKGNTVVNSGGGIFFHGAHHNLVRDNVLYNNSVSNFIAQDEKDKNTLAITGNDVQHNYMYQNGWSTYLMSMIYPDILVSSNKIDNNYISAPFSPQFASMLGVVNRTEWSVKTDFDLHSRAEPVPYELSGAGSPEEYAVLVYNPTPKDTVIVLDHTYMSFDSVVHTGSISLQPYKSAILFRYQAPVDLLDAPVGDDHLCIGASAKYQVAASLHLADVDTIVWTISPPAAGLIKSVSGDNGSVVEFTWLPNFLPSPVQLTYSARMNNGSNCASRPLIVSLNQDTGRPPTPSGPTDITNASSPDVYTATNPGKAEIEWIISPGAGTLSPYDHHGNAVTVIWKPNLLGRYTITYRLRNSCGEWGAEAFPLYYYFQTAAPDGPGNVCEGVRTCFTAPAYTDIRRGFTWVLEPATAGYLESNGNEACVTLNQSAANGTVSLYYTGLNSLYRSFQSPAITLTLGSLPATPAKPTGPDKVYLNRPAETYQATSTGIQYEWKVTPSQAAEIQNPTSEKPTILWGPAYLGEATVEYRVRNDCGWSEMSDPLAVQIHQSDVLENIPEIFTPNGDGFNDTWDIPAIHLYPEAMVRIYNRAKKLMVEFKGAQMPWDGRDRNGNLLESGYYLYQVELKKDGKVVSGYVTILR